MRSSQSRLELLNTMDINACFRVVMTQTASVKIEIVFIKP
jgi:hypothetical protein